MITALLVIACIAAYVAIAAGIFGYLKGTSWGEADLFVAALFPIAAIVFGLLLIARPVYRLGEWIQQRQSAKAKKRIEAQTKTRIELEKAERLLQESEQEAERSLEDQFRALDRKERGARW